MDVREILIPGRSMALAGHGMEGKTLMLIELAAAALNRSAFDVPPRVVVSASTKLTLCFRAEFGSAASDVEFIEPTSLKVTSINSNEEIEAAFALLERLARLHRPNLIILQSIDALVGTCTPTRSMFERTMRRLSEFALRLHTAVLTIEPNIGTDERERALSDGSLSNDHEPGVRGIDFIAPHVRLQAQLEHWLARGELEAMEIVRRAVQEGYSLLHLEQAKRSLGVRSYVRLSEGVRRRVWRLRDN